MGHSERAVGSRLAAAGHAAVAACGTSGIPATGARLDGVQMLRGVAAMLVVLHHAIGTALTHGFGFQSLAPITLGGAGVDLFFVISGFIIDYTAGRGDARDRSASTFLRRRVVRLVPLYWTLTLAAFALSVLLGAAVNTRPEPSTLAYSMAFLPEPAADGGARYVIPMAWSLTYEWMFYLLYALCLPLTAGHRLAAMTALLGGAALVGTVVQPDAPLLRDLVNPINLEFLLGIACAVLWRRGVRIGTAACAAVIVAALLALWPWREANLEGFTRVLAIGLPLAAMVWAVVLVRPVTRSGAAVAVAAPFVRLGDLSYSLYLSHFFALAAYARLHRVLVARIALPAWLEWLLMLGLCVAIAELCFRAIEQPWQRRLSGARSPA